MVSNNWKNKWVLTLMAGIAIQAIVYTLIAILKFPEFSIHPYFYDVCLIGFISVIIQAGGFAVIMSKTLNEDPAIYGQGRPFQHKLREEDEDVADRKPTHVTD
ncbi:MAG: hypothetical protein EAX95_05885 [Candidatus Thorarchaeota archaeon]|nr:hypothetical protein [Candidatus Thorarchaeota archaeon]